MRCELMQSSGSVPMTIGGKTALGLLALALLLWTGCGDIFRPVANPIPGPTPDPQNFHFAIVISQNAPGNPGSGMQVDVSGDTNTGTVQVGSVGLATLGQGPVHAAILSPGGNRIYVANGIEDSVTTFTPANVLSSIGAPTTITLPTIIQPPGSNPQVIHSNPVFVHSTESGNMYVANSGVFPSNSSICPNTSSVAVINTASQVVTNFICVGLQPAVLAETPDTRKLYSVNKGDGTVTAINTADKTVNKTLSGFNGLVWAAASLDSTKLYVLDQSGVSVVDTFTDTVIATVALPSGSNFMFLDGHLNRLYVTNPTAGTVTILDATVTPPQLIPNSVPLPATVAMSTALNDGSRAYVASYNLGPCVAPNNPADTCVFSQVTVIRESDNTLSSTVDMGSVDLTSTGLSQSKAVCDFAAASGRFPVSIASSVDSTKVYVANCYAGTTSIIRTSDDTLAVPLSSPVSAYPSCSLPGQPQPPPPCPASGPLPPPPPQNPLWVIAGP